MTTSPSTPSPITTESVSTTVLISVTSTVYFNSGKKSKSRVTVKVIECQILKLQDSVDRVLRDALSKHEIDLQDDVYRDIHHSHTITQIVI